ncbi:hypothetical protein AVEN_6568-1 [Araneus ventricosus]|uniref:Uncharacterized protein n=1 Tax=Araneus ventricosus TaxID=182803 RepID=A0A4Y2TG31_ARAVE|nr:hypothetical protein AVEN_6568-1 [Araneus ventricosus]
MAWTTEKKHQRSHSGVWLTIAAPPKRYSRICVNYKPQHGAILYIERKATETPPCWAACLILAAPCLWLGRASAEMGRSGFWQLGEKLFSTLIILSPITTVEALQAWSLSLPPTDISPGEERQKQLLRGFSPLLVVFNPFLTRKPSQKQCQTEICSKK